MLLLSASAFTALAEGGDPVLGGYVRYNSAGQMGWYTMDAQGKTYFQWIDQLSHQKYSPMLFGWMKDGRICGITSRLEGGILYNYQYIEMNPENGEYLVTRDVNMRNDDGKTNYLNYYNCATYDSTTDRVYGYGYNATGTAFVFKSSTPDFSETTIIREIPDTEFCYTITYNDVEKRLVGFNRTYFVYIDPATGTQTTAYYPALSNYQSTYTGMMYDLSKRAYYWNYFTKDDVSHMALVDIAGKKMTNVCDYTDMTQFSFMVPMGEKLNPLAPAAPEVTALDFSRASLSGNISFKLPAKTNGGNPLNGDVNWTLTIDGLEVKSDKGAPGSSVTAPVNVQAAGEHIFAVTAKTGTWESIPASELKYVGLDTPAAPQGVRLDATKLTWQPVKNGMHGGYVDESAVTYEVTFNGTSLGTTSATSINVTYPADKTYAPYSASVKAVNSSGASAESVSNTYLTGKPLTVPQTFVPDQTTCPLFTMEDTDGNGNVWAYNNGARGQELFISGYSADTPVDEWFFLPPMACNDKNTVYSFSLNTALNADTDKPAYVEVCAGTRADSKDMKTVIVPLTQLTRTSMHEYSGLFTISGELANAQSVVIGVRAYAPEGGARLKARRFKVEATKINAAAPANPAELTVKAAPEGALKVLTSFTMPDKLLNGTPIASGTDVTVTLFGDNKVTVTGKPGEKKEAELNAYHGINEIEVTPSLGTLKGQTKIYEVYCGTDVPLGVRNLKIEISEDNLEAILSWDAPDEGLNEGYVGSKDVTYNLCTFSGSTGEYVFFADLGSIPEYTMNLDDGARLATYHLAIQAVTNAGTSPVHTPAIVQLGTPHTLDIFEQFVDRNGKPAINYNPLSAISAGEYANTSWKVGDPSADYPSAASPTGVALIGSCDMAGTTGYILLPKFSAAGKSDIKLEFQTFRNNSMPDVTVWARGYGMDEDVAVGTIDKTGYGYSSQVITLPSEFNNLPWVSIHLTADYSSDYQYVIISQYAFTANNSSIELPEEEGAVSIRALKGTLEITGAYGNADIYRLDGMKVASIVLTGQTERIVLSPGIYMVNANGRAIKVLVK